MSNLPYWLTKNFLCSFCTLLFGLTSHSQFRPEDKRFFYTKVENTNSTVQRAGETIKIQYSLTVDKRYTADTQDASRFLVEITGIRDSVNSEGETKVYSSDSTTEANSLIDKSIRKYINSRQILSIGARVPSILPSSFDDSANFIEQLIGLGTSAIYTKHLPMSIDFPLDTTYKVGQSWKETTKTSESKILSTYTLESRNTSSIVVKYKCIITSKLVNTNINGAIVIDTYSGIVTERSSKSISVGYISQHGEVFFIDKRSSTLEQIFPAN